LIFTRHVVTLVAEPMPESDVVGGEATSVHLESRIVVSRRHPIGTRRYRLEVPTTPEAVALGHFATHVDELATPGKSPKDPANSKGLKLLNSGLSGTNGWRGFGHKPSINAGSEGKQGIRLRNPQPPLGARTSSFTLRWSRSRAGSKA
jgi:hypothetical protein